MRLCHQVSLLSTFAIGLALTACGSHAADDGSAVANDAITGTPQAFQAGDELVTTGNLNLREQPSLSASVLTVMPRGSSVTVASLDDPTSDEKGELDDTGDAPPASDDPGAGTDDSGACVDHGDACTLGDTCCDADDVCGDDPDFPGATVCTTLFAHRAPSVPGPGVVKALAEPSAGGATTNPTGQFYYVNYQGQLGWASGTYLRSANGAPAPGGGGGSAGGSSCMSKLAQVSTVVDGQPSRHMCYAGVKEHLGTALGVGFDGIQSLLGAGYQLGAYDFARWMQADPGGRASRAGFVVANDVTLDNLPLGAILVWRPGQCGYSAQYGHIEVNVGHGRACSDFCGTIARTCGAPMIVLLQKDC
jgi:hypothetical protein